MVENAQVTPPLGLISRMRLWLLLSEMSRWPVKGTPGGSAGNAAAWPGSRNPCGAGVGRAADDAPVGVVLTAGVRAWGTTDAAVDAHAVINMQPVTTAQRRLAPPRLTERLHTPTPSTACR